MRLSFIFGLVIAVEIFALANRGGGPLLSHLFLTGATFLVIAGSFFAQGKVRIQLGLPEILYDIFFLFFLFSLLVSKTPNFGLSEFLLFANAGILFWLLAHNRPSEQKIHWFSVALIAVATIDAIAGFFIYVWTPFPRFTGTFTDLGQPYLAYGNDFANFLLLILPLAIWMLFKKYERFTTSILLVFSCAILLSGFLLTFSRGAWISFVAAGVIGAGFYFFVRSHQNTLAHQNAAKKTIFARLLCTLLLATVMVTGLQLTRSLKFRTTPLLLKASFQADEGGASIKERIDFWKGAIEIIKENPLFGAGVLSFKFLYPQHQPDFGANWDHPHNIFLEIGVDNGLIAAIFFLMFLIACAAAAVKFLKKNPGHIGFPLALGALASLGHNLIDFNFIVSNFVLFIVFLGVLVAFARGGKSPPISDQEEKSSAKFFLGGFALISFFLLVFGIHEGFYNADFKRGRNALAAGDNTAALYHLERAQNLFFKRDLINYLASAYQIQYENSRDEALRDKEKRLLEAESSQTLDAAVFSRLGEIAFEEKDFVTAQKRAEQSLGLDPQNHLKYYHQLSEAKRAQGTPIEPDFKKKILDLLEEYKVVLKNNRHITITTENPAYASKLYEFFGMEKEREEFDALWFNELLKFTVQYGPDGIFKKTSRSDEKPR